MPKTLEWVDVLKLPKPNYQGIWDLQRLRVDAIAEKQESEAVFLCEHELVITKGRRAREQNILNSSVPSFDIERGGDVTLHQPGQLVIYPLIKLHGEIFRGGLHEYLRFCEEVVIQTLASFGIAAGRYGPTGVWVKVANGDAKKIASIGVAVRRWITYHGISLNVCNHLKEFQNIRPCDFDSTVMTSMTELGVTANVAQVARVFQEMMGRALSVEQEAQPQRVEAILTAS